MAKIWKWEWLEGVAWEEWLQGCGLGEEVTVGGVAWERKWLQGVWPGRGSGCRECGLEEEVAIGCVA